MKKQYTKKQITEAIAYWEKQLNESAYSDFITSEDGKELKDMILRIIQVSKKLTVSSAKFGYAIKDTSHGSYDRQQNMSSLFFSYLEQFKNLRKSIREWLGEEDDGWSNDVIWIGNPDEGQFNVIINEPYKDMFGAI